MTQAYSASITTTQPFLDPHNAVYTNTNIVAASNVVSLTASTWTNITGYSVTIIPTSNTAHVLLIGSINLGIHAATESDDFKFRLFNGTSAIAINTDSSPGNRILCTFSSPHSAIVGAAQTLNFGFTVLDSPATTSSITYTLQIYSESTTPTYSINCSTTDTNSNAFVRTASTFTAIQL